MKRTLTTLGVAFAALALSAGPAAAGEHHGGSEVAGHRHNHQAPAHPRHDCTVAPKCRPAPLPKPPGGWPCAKDHSCSTKHHHPICPPTKPPVKPPVHPKPKPPVHREPTPKTPARAVPVLPRTGPVGDVLTLGGLGLGAIALGVVPFVLTRRPKTVTDAIRGELS